MSRTYYTEPDEKLKASYLKDPAHCPYCKSNNLDVRIFDGETQEVVCLDCEQYWLDIYTLTDVRVS